MIRILHMLFLVALSVIPVVAADLRVMSFNIRYGNARDGENHWQHRKEFVAETIAAFDPDLLGTQETLEFQKDFLNEKLPEYTSIGVGRDDGGDTGEMTALFYKTKRFQKLDEGHFWLSETPDKPGSISWDSSLTRMASWVRLQDRRSPYSPAILFINTHFDHKGQQAREESAKLIRRMAESIGEHCDIVITGDFNAGADSPPYQRLFHPVTNSAEDTTRTQVRKFVDTYRATGSDDSAGEATFSGFRAGVTDGARIDWIAIAGNWRVLAATIDRTSRDGRTPSDHYPVTATLQQTKSLHQPLRLLSYNIKRGLGNDGNTDLSRTADRIGKHSPDIVALQEVDENTKRSGEVDQAAELGRTLDMQHAFAPFMDYQGGRYGLASLSKLPIEKVETVTLPTGNEPRVALAVTITLPSDQTITVVNLHLDWVRDDSFRFAQAQHLRQYLDQLPHPYLLMGDFNDTPDSRTLELLSNGTTPATKPSDDPFTFSSIKPEMEIDFILGYPASKWRFENTQVIDDPLTSDHRPVYTEAYLSE